jgi:hypothetical protein
LLVKFGLKTAVACIHRLPRARDLIPLARCKPWDRTYPSCGLFTSSRGQCPTSQPDRLTSFYSSSRGLAWSGMARQDKPGQGRDSPKEGLSVQSREETEQRGAAITGMVRSWSCGGVDPARLPGQCRLGGLDWASRHAQVGHLEFNGIGGSRGILNQSHPVQPGPKQPIDAAQMV